MAGLLDRLQTFLFGAAIGRAASESITPVLEPVRQHAWQKNRLRVLDPATAAEARAKGIVDEADAEDDASRNGYDADRFGVLLRLAQAWPGIGELAQLSNRDLANPGTVIEALTRHGYPGDLVGTVETPGPLVELFQQILSPGELAAAIHRGLVPAENLVLGEQPAPPFKVEAYPVQPINAVKEAAGSGFDRERLQVLVGLQGLPMGPHEAAQAFFRGIITHGDYIRAFNTSNMRNEWAQAILDQTRQIPTARDFFENALRGYHDLEWAQREAERHGMSPEDSLVIYQNQGRPMNPHAITQALARGGKFKPEPGELTDPYDAAIVEGNLKPAYYDLAKANRYLIPGYFVLKAILDNGGMTVADFEEYGKQLGWPPELAKKAAEAFDPARASGKENPFVGRAETQLWTAIHKAYVKDTLNDATVDSALLTLIPDDGDRGIVVGLWKQEKQIGAQAGPPA